MFFARILGFLLSLLALIFAQRAKQITSGLLGLINAPLRRLLGLAQDSLSRLFSLLTTRQTDDYQHNRNDFRTRYVPY